MNLLGDVVDLSTPPVVRVVRVSLEPDLAKELEELRTEDSTQLTGTSVQEILGKLQSSKKVPVPVVPC